jgi:ABC-type uncharacterized transport system substrate-binding protein
MRRREFIAGLLLTPFATLAFAVAKRISILHSGIPNRTPVQVLLEALRGLGYEHGNTAVIEVLGAEGDAKRLDALVADLAARKPDVIIALTSPAEKRQVACGKNGTSAAILGKRRLLGERMLAACNAGIWRTSG